MPVHDATTAAVRRCAAAAVAVLLLGGVAPATRAAGETSARTVAISTAVLESVDATRRLVSSAAETGATTLLVPVPLEDLEPARAQAIDAVIRDARGRGLRVLAALHPTVAAPAGDLPIAREHVVFRRPEWLMVPRELAMEMLALDPRSPDYIGRLARWTRANAGRADGLYLSVLQPDVTDYLAAAVLRVVQRFPVDGIHLDGVRFPGPDFDYSRRTMETFRAAVRRTLPDAERARLDAVETVDPFGYAEELVEEWRRFRVSRLTALVTRLRSAVHSVRPDAVVTAAVIPGADLAAGEYLQDWRTWLDNRFVDALADARGGSATLLSTYDTLLAPPAAGRVAEGPSGNPDGRSGGLDERSGGPSGPQQQ